MTLIITENSDLVNPSSSEVNLTFSFATPEEDLAWLADQGAKFTSCRGRNKGVDGDGHPTFTKGHLKRPLNVKQALKAHETGNNVFVIAGETSGHIVAIDLDANFWTQLFKLGPNRDVAKILRTNATNRGKLLVRMENPPKSKAWPIRQKDEIDYHPQVEFIGKGRVITCPPSVFNEGQYRIVDEHLGIPEIDMDELESIWFELTGEHFSTLIENDPDEDQSDKKAREKKTAHPKWEGGSSAYLQQVKDYWSAYSVFEHFGWVKNGVVKASNGDIRILKNGGLLVGEPNGPVRHRWNHRSHDVGGDQVHAWTYCKFGTLKKLTPKEFIEVIHEMGDAAGIKDEMPPLSLEMQRTDLGNAVRLTRDHANEINFVSETTVKTWMVWDGKRHCEDAGHLIRLRAIKTVRQMEREAIKIDDHDKRVEAVSYALSCGSKRSLDNMVSQAEPLVATTREMFDPDPYILNCENGVLNLKTGELKPHDPKYFCSRLAMAYDPNCSITNWLSFLDLFLEGDTKMIDFLRRSGGYTLTGEAIEKHFWVLSGPKGNNGKSTFLSTLAGIMRDYEFSMRLQVLTQRPSHGGDTATPSLVQMRGARLLLSDEIPDGWRPDMALIKGITSGAMDKVNVRGLFKGSDKYTPTQKLWLFGNAKPKISADDDASWDRHLLVPFNYQIPKANRDPKFQSKLQKEYPGILAWFAGGTRDWLESGLMVPNQVTDATAEHREDMDMVRRFLSEACETEPPATSKLRTPVKYLYAAWEHWRKGKSAPPYTERDFAQKLEGMGFPYKDTSTVGRVRVGIRLLEHAYPEGKEEGEPEAVTVRQNGKVLQPGDLS